MENYSLKYESQSDVFNDKLHYEFAVMNGSGINRKDNNNYKDVIEAI